MPYQHALVGRVFALRWMTAPEHNDLRALATELLDARKRVGAPLINLSLLPQDVSAPDLGVRKEMENVNRVFAETCEVIHVVVGGEGFKHAIFRSIVSTLALAAPKRGLVRVHRNIDEAFDRIRETSDVDLATLRLKISDAGLLAGF